MKRYFTTSEIAKLLGLSRIAVFKRIKKGKMKAIKIGRSYVISKACFPEIIGKKLSQAQKRKIESAVRKIVKEYGETLKLLGKA